MRTDLQRVRVATVHPLGRDRPLDAARANGPRMTNARDTTRMPVLKVDDELSHRSLGWYGLTSTALKRTRQRTAHHTSGTNAN